MQHVARAATLAGVRLHALDEHGLIQHVITALDQPSGGWLVNPNVDVLRKIERDPEIRDLVSSATLVIADGAPVEWAARLAGQPLPPRVPGATLIWTLSTAAAAAGHAVFLLGGNPGVAERAAAELQGRCPGLIVAGTHCPPQGFENDLDESSAIRTVLRMTSPRIVFCGLGFPKQERLMSALSKEFPETWFIGSGASLSFAAGETRRAPLWMQRAGMEWLFRLGSEPRRLARRYLIDDLPYAARLLTRSALEGRRQARLNSPGEPLRVPGQKNDAGDGLCSPSPASSVDQ